LKIQHIYITGRSHDTFASNILPRYVSFSFHTEKPSKWNQFIVNCSSTRQFLISNDAALFKKPRNKLLAQFGPDSGRGLLIIFNPLQQHRLVRATRVDVRSNLLSDCLLKYQNPSI